MKIKDKKVSGKFFLCLIIYYAFARFLPVSYAPIVGKICKKFRYFLCKRLFRFCGENVNVERMAWFGSGIHLEIGDNSGLGINCHVPSNTIIGKDVMMGPNVFILGGNHGFDRLDIPMWQQKGRSDYQTLIGNDIWIGRNVTMTPGRHIADGSIIGACCVLTKNFPEFSIVGGNPSKYIKSRK